MNTRKTEAVDWMLKNVRINSREEAVKLGQQLVDDNLIEHVGDAYQIYVGFYVQLDLWGGRI